MSWLPTQARLYPPTMELDKTTLERAFELAASGAMTSLSEIRAQLKAEGYSLSQLQGRSLIRQLRQIMREARS